MSPVVIGLAWCLEDAGKTKVINEFNSFKDITALSYSHHHWSDIINEYKGGGDRKAYILKRDIFYYFSFDQTIDSTDTPIYDYIKSWERD